MLTEEDAEALNGITYHTSADDILAVAEASGGTWNDYKEGASVEILPKAPKNAPLRLFHSPTENSSSRVKQKGRSVFIH